MDRDSYLNLITSEYINKPLFRAATNKLLEDAEGASSVLEGLSDDFSLENAVGAQLDTVGQYLNFSRNVYRSAGMGKNKLKNDLEASGSKNGVSWVVNSDGSITVTGAALSATYLDLDINFDTSKFVGYIANGLPSIGSAATFMYRICVSTSDRNPLQNIVSNEAVLIDNGVGVFSIRIATGTPGSGNSYTFNPMVSKEGGEFEPYLPSGVYPVNDNDYRLLLKARVLQYRWDGSFGGLYKIFESLFPGSVIIIDDEGNTSYTVSVAFDSFPEETLDYFVNGYILPKPAGVEVSYNIITDKRFVWDLVESNYNAGWDVGKWFK